MARQIQAQEVKRGMNVNIHGETLKVGTVSTLRTGAIKIAPVQPKYTGDCWYLEPDEEVTEYEYTFSTHECLWFDVEHDEVVVYVQLDLPLEMAVQ